MSGNIHGKGCLAAALGLAVFAARADTVFVNHAATGANNGQTWPDAFTSLRAALAAVRPGDQVWVAKGAYTPAPPNGNRDDTFALPSGVGVYGGFAGIETSLAQRDPVANPTILSGDLNGNDTPGFGNIAENSRHVLTATGVNETGVLDGFVVRGGNADHPGEALLGGGGLIINSCSPTIVGCRFEGNSAGENKPNVGGFGGALYVKVDPPLGAAPAITSCVFSGNRGDNGGALGVVSLEDFAGHRVVVTDCDFIGNAAPFGLGGAVFGTSSSVLATGEEELRFVGCRFENNLAQYGGVIFDNHTRRLSLVDCGFTGNRALVLAGVLWNIESFSLDQEAAVIDGCSFIGNRAEGPGGVLMFGSTRARVTNCAFFGNTAAGDVGGAILMGSYSGSAGCGLDLDVANCVFSGNIASGGGGIAAGCSTVRIADSTFGGNSAGIAGGAISSAALMTIENCVLFGNDAGGAMTEEGQVATSPVQGQLTVNHSCVQGLTGALGGVGNIGQDPLYADADGPDGVVGTADDDLRLSSPGSACIDAGSNLAVPTFIQGDLDGNLRFVDDPGTPDTGVPGGVGGSAVVDMGAYEFQAVACYPDCNADGSLTVADFGCFQGKYVLGDLYADCNGDGARTVADFGCFQTEFVAGCP